MGKCRLVMRIEIERLAVKLDRGRRAPGRIADEGEERERIGRWTDVFDMDLAEPGSLGKVSGVSHSLNLGQAARGWDESRSRRGAGRRYAPPGVGIGRGPLAGLMEPTPRGRATGLP